MEFKRKHYVDELIKRKHNGMIKIITGLRRSGKSYLLNTLFVRHLEQSGVASANIIHIDLEDVANMPLRDPLALLHHIENRSSGSPMYYVIMDEVQLIPHFEEILNTLLKRQKYDVYVTGSNSRFLVSDVVTEFRGRGDEVRIYPLSMAELHEAFPDRSWDELWRDYSNFGGLPQVALMNDASQKSKYLKQLFQTTYFKDIIDRYPIQQVEQFGQLADFVASAVGSLTNPLKLSKTFQSKGLKIADDTVKQYLDYLQDAFLIAEAKRYDIRGKQYIGSPYKYYFTDIGLRNARLNFRQYEETHIMENIIYTELLRRGCEVDVGLVEIVERVNGKQEHKRLEIDFVANRGSERYYIQSAYAMPDEDKVRQEERPLLKVPDSFKKIIVVKEPVLAWHNDNGTTIISLQQFMLEDDSLKI